MNEKSIKSVPFSIIANKKDIAKMDLQQLIKTYEIDNYSDRNVKVFEASALTGEGLR